MGFDWKTATTDEKKLLFEMAHKSGIARGLKWSEFTMVVFKRLFSEDDIDNCRAGRMGIPRCRALHKWMHENDADHAKQLDADLGISGFPKVEVWLTSKHKTPDGRSVTTKTLLRTRIYEPDGERIVYGSGKPSERPEPEGPFTDIHEDGLSVRIMSHDDSRSRD